MTVKNFIFLFFLAFGELKKFKLEENYELSKFNKKNFIKNIEFDSENKFLLNYMISSEDFGKTLEAEAYYLFGERGSFKNNCSIKDAKELETRFNQIEKSSIY